MTEGSPAAAGSIRSIRVEVVQAWPRRHLSKIVELPPDACVKDALAVVGIASDSDAGFAIYGEKVDLRRLLRDGDRIEALRPLLADPKDARRLRARKTKGLE